MKTSIRAVAVATAVAASSVAIAGPAAADHLLIATRTWCTAGVFSGAGLYGNIDTQVVKIRNNSDRTVTATCTFTGIPETAESEYFEDNTWTRPASGSTYTDPNCFLDGKKYEKSPAYVESYGIPARDGATFTYLEAGKAVAVCTFDLVNPR